MRNFLMLSALLVAGCASGGEPFALEEDNARPQILYTKETADDNVLSFAILSDLTGGYRYGVFDIAVNVINKLDVDFVISIGDMIQGFSDEEDEIIREWEAFEEVAAGLKRPLAMTPGNHDIFSALSRDIWEERFGPAYYAFRRGPYLFIVLNTEDFPDELLNFGLTDINRRIDVLTDRGAPGYEKALASRNVLRKRILSGEYTYYNENFNRMIEEGEDMWRQGLVPPSLNPDAASISDAQHKFFEDTLQRHKDARWTFVFLHKPIWIGEGAHDFWRLADALNGRSYTMFAGHLHQYSNREIAGNDHIRLSVTGGGVTDKIEGRALAGTFDHVTHVTLGDGDPVISNFVLKGVLDKNGDPYSTNLEGPP